MCVMLHIGSVVNIDFIDIDSSKIVGVDFLPLHIHWRSRKRCNIDHEIFSWLFSEEMRLLLA